MATVSMGNVLEACGLVHEPTQNLIICQRCRYALAPSRSQVTSHLLRKHQAPSPVCKGLCQEDSDRHCIDLNGTSEGSEDLVFGIGITRTFRHLTQPRICILRVLGSRGRGEEVAVRPVQ